MINIRLVIIMILGIGSLQLVRASILPVTTLVDMQKLKSLYIQLLENKKNQDSVLSDIESNRSRIRTNVMLQGGRYVHPDREFFMREGSGIESLKGLEAGETNIRSEIRKIESGSCTNADGNALASDDTLQVLQAKRIDLKIQSIKINLDLLELERQHKKYFGRLFGNPLFDDEDGIKSLWRSFFAKAKEERE